MSRIPNLNDLSFDAVIPSALLLNENIEPNAIKLYAFVRGLTRAHGYCYATNEYLAGCMKMCTSATRNLLSSLEKEGFITKKYDEETGQRHIYLGDGLKKCLRVLKIQQGGAENSAGGCQKSSTIYKDNIFDKNVFNINAPQELSDFLLKKLKSIKPDFTKGVSPSWLKEFAKLLKKRTSEQLQKLMDWIFEDSFWSGVVHSPGALLKNIDKIEMQMGKKSQPNAAKEWIEKLKERVKNHHEIYVGEHSVSFTAGVTQLDIKYTDSAYQQQIINRLRKMNISVEDL